MWIKKEIERIGKKILTPDATLESYLDDLDIEAIKSQGTTYNNLKDRIYSPKVSLNTELFITLK